MRILPSLSLSAAVINYMCIIIISMQHVEETFGQDLYSVRLVGRSSSLEGTVEVYVNGAWGTVCGEGWDIRDATVVCRQLGYPSASSAFYAGRGTQVIANVRCSGTETNIAECTFNSGFIFCSYYEDAGVVCNDWYSLRLIGGSTSSEGRVEVNVNGVWGTVCDDEWDFNDATVVCTQLGYSLTISAKTSAYFGQGSGDVVLEDVACTGKETNLAECPHSTLNNCGPSKEAGVLCADASENYDVRLANGTSSSEGRVEVYVNGAWGTVCDDDWSRYDGKVVCTQLGLGSVASAKYNAYFGEGSGESVLSRVACHGTESNLGQCRASSSNCLHDSDAGVICSVSEEISYSYDGISGGIIPVIIIVILVMGTFSLFILFKVVNSYKVSMRTRAIERPQNQAAIVYPRSGITHPAVGISQSAYNGPPQPTMTADEAQGTLWTAQNQPAIGQPSSGITFPATGTSQWTSQPTAPPPEYNNAIAMPTIHTKF